MIVSAYLEKMGVEYYAINEMEIDSLGLAGYNNGDRVCTFIEDEKYIDGISKNVVEVITTDEIANIIQKHRKDIGIIVVQTPRIVFFSLHNHLSNIEEYVGIKKKTVIGEDCNISSLSSIAGNNVIIGDNVIIEDFVVIRENTYIGDNCIIRAGSKIGGEGFEFKKKGQGLMPVKHVGHVQIGNNVEIQYNSCIDKAIYPWDYTEIKDNVKIDNLVHIAHAVKIGQNSMVVANSGIGGRVSIGENCWIGFGATIRNGLIIEDSARVNMGAVVTKNVNSGQSVSGNFAIEHKAFICNMKKNNLQ